MRSEAPIRRLLIGLALAGLALSCFSPAVASESLAVVVSPDVEVDELTFADFRKIMLGDRQFWKSGQRITLIVRGPDSPERELLLKQVYKMNEAQFRQYWIAKVFRAEIPSQPRIVVSNDEAVDLIGVMEGGITVVNAADVPEGLKVLKIGGKSPGDEGYLGK